MSTYDVKVVREGDDWVAHWGSRSTFASSLRALDTAVREVIILAEDLPDEAAAGLTLRFMFDLAGLDGYGDAVSSLAEARHDLAVAQERVARQTANAVGDLREYGLSVRDVAEIVGLSHQRVSQVMAEAPARG